MEHPATRRTLGGTYTRILERTAQLPNDSWTLVRYEDLIAHPTERTARLFAFIGSSRRAGTDVYARGDFEWRWGTDDGSEHIRTLRVQPQDAAKAVTPEILSALDTREMKALRMRFRYLPQG